MDCTQTNKKETTARVRGSSVLIVGMHRSGTSALTCSLHQLGLSAGNSDLMDSQPSNPKGFGEVESLTNCNNRILERLGGDWRSLPFQLFHPQWWSDNSLDDLRQEARASLCETFSTGNWVWKDPRLCLTLRFWLGVMGEPQAVIFIYRHPLEVWRSLHARDGIPKSEGLAIWELYNKFALNQLRGLPVLVVKQSELLGHPQRTFNSIADFLNTKKVGNMARSKRASARHVIDPSLRHWTESTESLHEDLDLTQAQRDLYELLEQLPTENDCFDGAELADWREPFTEVCAGLHQRVITLLQKEHTYLDRINNLTNDVSVLNANVEVLTTSIDQIEQQLCDNQVSSENEKADLFAELRELCDLLARTDAAVKRQTKRAEWHARELKQLQESRTHKVGRAVLAPFRLFRQVPSNSNPTDDNPTKAA